MATDAEFQGFGPPESSWWKSYLGVAAVLFATPVLIPPLFLATALLAPFAIVAVPVMWVVFYWPRPEDKMANERVRLLQWEKIGSARAWHPRRHVVTP
jgi:hypothetical protein